MKKIIKKLLSLLGIIPDIGIYLESPDAKMPTISYGTSACFDCYCTKDTVIPAGGFAFPPIDVRIMIPTGYYLNCRTRSSMGFKKNLVVYHGCIDAGFCGTFEPKIYNFGKEDVLIEKGKACCQFELQRIPWFNLSYKFKKDWNQYCKDSKTIRGNRGYGSTDRK